MITHKNDIKYQYSIKIKFLSKMLLELSWFFFIFLIWWRHHYVIGIILWHKLQKMVSKIITPSNLCLYLKYFLSYHDFCPFSILMTSSWWWPIFQVPKNGLPVIFLTGTFFGVIFTCHRDWNHWKTFCCNLFHFWPSVDCTRSRVELS